MARHVLLASALVALGACAHKAPSGSAVPAPATVNSALQPAASVAEGAEAAAKSEAQAAPAAPAAVSYSCPMHRDVKASQPGRCTKCGMALEAETPKP